jgi:hypothetical protein
MTVISLPKVAAGPQDKKSVQGAPATVISLSQAKTREEYFDALREIVAAIGEMDERLTTLGFGALLEGPLHDWAVAQPVGMVMSFGEGDLLNSGEPELIALVNLFRFMRETKEIMSKQLDRPSIDNDTK